MFKIGDRVAIYVGDDRSTGIIRRINDYGTLFVRVDGLDETDEYGYHPKQCRILKIKKRRRIWVSTQINQADFESESSICRCTHLTLKECKGWIEFAEVREKK